MFLSRETGKVSVLVNVSFSLELCEDISNTAWAFATSGEYCKEMFDVFADEACRRVHTFNNQHVSMVLWAFVTLRHRHDQLFRTLGARAEVGGPVCLCRSHR